MMRALKALAATLLAVVGLLAIYGSAIEPRFILDERSYTVEVAELPAELDGLRGAVFSDLQIGMWLANEAMVERIVRRAVDADPDAVLLGGDFVYSRAPDVSTQIDRVIELLTPLTDSGIPTFAVLGNHDYAVGAAEELTAALEEHDVAVLRNGVATLPGAAGTAASLHVVGIGPARPGHSDPAAALAEVPDDAPRMILMHNPTTFDELPPDSAPLSVAGHTHCGQIAIPGLPAWSYLELRADERMVVDGFAPPSYGAAGNRLFVTCGIGFSVVPMRVAAAPQLVFFELVPR